MADRASIEALTRIIEEVETIISTTTPMPENRSARCLELFRAAKALAADLGRQGGKVAKPN
jgi:hypothetical protein